MDGTRGEGGGLNTDRRQNSCRGCALHLYGRFLLLGLHAALVEALLPLLNLPNVCQRELKVDDVRILPAPAPVRSEAPSECNDEQMRLRSSSSTEAG